MGAILPVKPNNIKPSRLTSLEKQQFSLSKDLKDITIGLLLGDLYAQKNNVNARLKFEQGTAAGHRSLHLTMERPGPGSCSNSLGPNKA
jgi:hypothetical protein